MKTAYKSIIVIVLVSLLVSLIVFPAPFSVVQAQEAPGAEWEKTFGGSDNDWGYYVQQTTDGGYIIVGGTMSYTTDANEDVYLIKTDASGNKQWGKTFGGSDDDWGYSVQQTTDGGYIIAGIVGSNSFLDHHGDVYLIKTDALGNVQWEKTFGGSGDDWGCSVQQTTDGGYIITGCTESGAGDDDVYLIKTDALGNVQWEKTFGGSGDDWGCSIQQTTDGGYIISGMTASYGAGGCDVYLIKTDALGNNQWEKTFGGSSYDDSGSVQQTTDGGYIIAGGTESCGAGSCDVYLIKTDASGNAQWEKTFGGSGIDNGFYVQQTTDGGYIIAGETGSYSTDIHPQDIYLIKTDASGNAQWQKTSGGSLMEYCGSVQQTTDGGYIIAGGTVSYGAGSCDVYLIKVAGSSNQPPVASFTHSPESSPEHPTIDEEITFDASASYDPDGTIVNYAWNFGDGNSAGGMTATHAYSLAGQYTVTLTVTDNDGLTGSASSMIEVVGPVVKYLDKENTSREVKGSVADGASQVIIQISNLPYSSTLDDFGLTVQEGDGTLEDDAAINGEIFTQTYTSPERFVRAGHSGDLSTGEREIGLTISIKGLAVDHDPLYLAKAPVVLLHGLWDNANCWTDLWWKLRQNGFKYALAYSYPSSVHFEDNSGVIRKAVQASLNLAINDGFVAKKADVVCHSMGGLIARIYGDETYIKSITTVGTPYLGSPLADILYQLTGGGISDELLNPFDKFAASCFEKTGHPTKNGAVEDLRENGGIHTDAKMPNVDTYVIAGISPLTEPNSILFVDLLSKVFKFYGLIDIAATTLDANQYVFHDERNDWIVSESSQKGKMEGQDNYVIWHCTEPTDVEIQAMILGILNRTEAGIQAASALPTAQTLAQESPPPVEVGELHMNLSIGEVNIVSPQEGNVFSPGDVVDIEVNVSDANATVLVVTSTGESMLMDHSPYTFQFVIPEDSIGGLNISAGARDETGFIGWDDVTINVSSVSTLTGLTIYPEITPIYLEEGTTMPLTIYADFEDGITRDITSSGSGTIYTSSNTSVASISSEGIIRTLSAGESTITVENSGIKKEITIIVSAAVNAAPVAVADSYSVDEDAVLVVAAPGVLSNDTDVDGDTLEARLFTWPMHGNLVFNSDGSFSYTPAANYNGTDSFTYAIYDSSDWSNTAKVTIIVRPVNDAPVAHSDVYYTAKGTVLTVSAPGVLSNDIDVDGDALSPILVMSPSHGTLNLNKDGSFTYIPRKGYIGIDSFTYKANDGTSNSSEAIVTIGVGVDPYAINTPTKLAAKSSASTVTLTWIDTSNNEDGFYIERATKTKTGTTDFVRVGMVVINITTFSDTLVPGTYIYRVQAFNLTTGRVSKYSNQVQVRVQ